MTDQKRYLELPCQSAGTAYMVGMLMADQDGIESLPFDTYGSKPEQQFSGGKPGIYKHPAGAGFHKN
jgi:hypothetical protein